MSTTPEVTTTPDVALTAADVYWRPGCPYCSALRSDLSRLEVPVRWHNIWEDPDARQFVRSVNAGNETVPTVRVGSRTLTNPGAKQVAALVGVKAEQVTPADGVQADQALPSARGAQRVLSWVPTGGLIIAGVLVAQGGHAGVSWGLGGLAGAAWWVTRRLRR